MIRARQLLRLAALPPPRARSYADAAAGPAAMAFTFASPTQVRAQRRRRPPCGTGPQRGLRPPLAQPGVRPPGGPFGPKGLQTPRAPPARPCCGSATF